MSATQPTHLFDLGGGAYQQAPILLDVADDVLLLRVQLYVDAADVKALQDEGDEEGHGDDDERDNEEEVEEGTQRPMALRNAEVVPLAKTEVQQRGCGGGEATVFLQVRAEEYHAASGEGQQKDQGDEGVVDDALARDHERAQKDAEIAVEAKDLEHLQHHQHEDARCQHNQSLQQSRRKTILSEFNSSEGDLPLKF